MSARWPVRDGGRVVAEVETTGDGQVRLVIVEARRGQLRRFGTRRTVVASPEAIVDLRRALGLAIGVARDEAGVWERQQP